MCLYTTKSSIVCETVNTFTYSLLVLQGPILWYPGLFFRPSKNIRMHLHYSLQSGCSCPDCV